MRRWTVVIVVGAVVLGLVVAVAVLVGVVLPGLRQALEPDPPPTYAPGELTPEESTVRARPQPDGTLRVEQVLVFEVLPGLEDRPVTWYAGSAWLGWKPPDRAAQYAVLPTVTALEARQVPAEGGPVALSVTVEEEDEDDPFLDGRRYSMAGPEPWAPGRHRVELSYVLGNVWVHAEGARLLVLPLRFASGPGDSQPADLVRLTVEGVSDLQCPATNVDLAQRRACGDGGRLTFHVERQDQVEAVLGLDPAGITAEPLPLPERPR